VTRLPASIEKVVGALGKLPSIGPKTAQRLTFHLLKQPPDDARSLAAAIGALHEGVRLCETCHYFAENERCDVCNDPRRDLSEVCVVEDALNVLGLERTGAYHGLYHVLGGALSPLKDRGPDDLQIESLMRRLRDGAFREVILATNPTVEGEATAVYLARLIGPLGIRTSRLAQGLPAGGDLEYTDALTLQRAFEGRRNYDLEP